MTGAYAAFANGGLKATPYAITEIRTRTGRMVYDHDRNEPPPARVLPENVAFEMNDILVNVVEAGTGGRAKLEGHMAAGKTGTTQAYRDAWFVGFTGHYVSAVWFGNDDYTSTKNMTGGSLPAMTWQAIMTSAHQGLPPKPIPGVGDPNAVADTKAPAGAEAPQPSPNALTENALGTIAEIEALMRTRLSPDGIPTAQLDGAALQPVSLSGPQQKAIP